MRGPSSLTEGWCSDHMMISSFAKALNTRGYPMGSISQVFKARKHPNAAPGSVNYRYSATRAGRLRGRACMALKQTDAASTVTASGQQDEAVKAILFDMVVPLSCVLNRRSWPMMHGPHALTIVWTWKVSLSAQHHASCSTQS